MKRATWMTAVAMLAVAACAKGDKSAQQPADSTARNLTLAPTDSSSALHDVPANPPATPATSAAPPKSRPPATKPTQPAPHRRRTPPRRERSSTFRSTTRSPRAAPRRAPPSPAPLWPT